MKQTFTDQFKQQIVKLYNNGKPRSEIIREYDLTPSVFDKWVHQINATGAAKEKDNRTPEEIEVMKLTYSTGKSLSTVPESTRMSSLFLMRLPRFKSI